MERKRIPHFIHLLQSAAEMFPMSDDDQKWALSKGFIPDKIDLYGLNEGNADLWVPDFDYLMMHPLNNHFKFWVDDKLTLKYMLNTPPLSDLMPEYYLYVENDGRYTYLMNMPSGVDRDEGCLSSLLRHEHALAIKPNHGMGGAGFVKLELVAEGEMAANNVIIPREEFLNLESELSGCIVTEYIRQHDDLRKIWSGSECTLRVIMAKNVGSSKYREASYTCVLAYARFGTSRTGGASNLSQGGIGVPFDFETGLLNGGGQAQVKQRRELSVQRASGYGRVVQWISLAELRAGEERCSRNVRVSFLFGLFWIRCHHLARRRQVLRDQHPSRDGHRSGRVRARTRNRRS